MPRKPLGLSPLRGIILNAGKPSHRGGLRNWTPLNRSRHVIVEALQETFSIRAGPACKCSSLRHRSKHSKDDIRVFRGVFMARCLYAMSYFFMDITHRMCTLGIARLKSAWDVDEKRVEQRSKPAARLRFAARPGVRTREGHCSHPWKRSLLFNVFSSTAMS